MADFSATAWDEPEKKTLMPFRMGMTRLSYTTHASTGNGTVESDDAIYGEVLYAVTKPTDAHTDNFDLAVDDEYGNTLVTDATCDTTTTEFHAASLHNTYFYPPIAGKITVTITSAGDSKEGVVEVYYRW